MDPLKKLMEYSELSNGNVQQLADFVNELKVKREGKQTYVNKQSLTTSGRKSKTIALDDFTLSA